MDTQQLEALNEHDGSLVEAISGLVKTLRPVVKQNGKVGKQNTLQTWITIGSAIIILFTIGGFIYSYGGWRKGIDLNLTNSMEAIAANGNKIDEQQTEVNSERKRVWKRLEQNKDDRVEMKMNAARIETKVDILDIRQQVIGDDVKKILKKVE